MEIIRGTLIIDSREICVTLARDVLERTIAIEIKPDVPIVFSSIEGGEDFGNLPQNMFPKIWETRELNPDASNARVAILHLSNPTLNSGAKLVISKENLPEMGPYTL